MANSSSNDERTVDNENVPKLLSNYYKQKRRPTSGPPFYKGPRRTAAHGNPLRSLKSFITVPNPSSVKIKKYQAKSGAKGQRLTKPQLEAVALSSAKISQEAAEVTPNISSEVATGVVNSASNHLVSSVWRSDSQAHVHAKITESYHNENISNLYKAWQNPCMRADKDILDLSSDFLSAGINSSSLVPGLIDKNSLPEARVLQQVDSKFIAAVAGKNLLLIDQHAADERVLLEELKKQVLSGREKQKWALLDSPVELAISAGEAETIKAYKQAIQKWGWQCLITSDLTCQSSMRGKEGQHSIVLNAVPCILNSTLTPDDLIEYVNQLMETRSSSVPPPAVTRLLNSKSCRGAIMFGDTLNRGECKKLVEQLKLTQLCFQCAHGRPTMVPLVNLQALRRRLSGHTLRLQNLPRRPDVFCSARSTRCSPRQERPASGALQFFPRKKPQLGWHKLQNCPASTSRACERLTKAHEMV